MFNIGAGEMIFILVAALLVLGPTRLPELARGIGKFLREFRRQTDEVRTVVTREFYQMDQEIQREPVRPAPAPVLPTPALAEPSSPPSLGLPASADPSAYAHMLPTPMAPGAPVEPSIAPVEPGAAPVESGAAPVESGAAPVEPGAAQGVQSVAAAGEPEAAPGQSSEEEAVPRFAPIPGTVARNAPKQS